MSDPGSQRPVAPHVEDRGPPHPGDAPNAPYVRAVVVRAQRPASVRAGDSARVLGDGTIDGFVGGACAEQSVRLHALRCLETGEPLLLRIVPGEESAPATEGAVTVANPCLSGGALEIFLEPVLPSPRLCVVGSTPIAAALGRLGRELGLEVTDTPAPDDLAVVVASHGHGEPEALRAAVDGHAAYVGLVASPRRGAAVVEEAGLAPGLVDTPAGLDIGAVTPEEIALSILARVVAARRAAAAPPVPAPAPAAVGAPASAPAPSHCCHDS